VQCLVLFSKKNAFIAAEGIGIVGIKTLKEVLLLKTIGPAS
jgi:hypothetical protein